MSDATRWVRLEESNDWGAYFLRMPGWPMTASAPTQQVEFRSQVRVRWPDGQTEVVDVVTVQKQYMVSDHGHTNEVRSSVPHASVSVHGAPTAVPLDSLDVDVSSLAKAPEPESGTVRQ